MKLFAQIELCQLMYSGLVCEGMFLKLQISVFDSRIIRDFPFFAEKSLLRRIK